MVSVVTSVSFVSPAPLVLAGFVFNSFRREEQYQAESQSDQAHVAQEHISAPADQPAGRESQGHEDKRANEQHDEMSFLLCMLS